MTEQVFDPVIEQAKAQAAQFNTQIEVVLSQWEQGNPQLAGIVNYYKTLQGQPGNGAPIAPPIMPGPAPAPVVPAGIPQPTPVAQVPGGISDYAKNMLMQLCTSYNEDFNRLSQLFSQSHALISANNTIGGQQLDDQAVLFVQTRVQDEKSGNNAFFDFILLRHLQPYQRESKDEQNHPSGEGKQIIVTKKWTAGGWGIFRKKQDDGNIISRIGNLMVWDEEAARGFGSLKTYTTYRAELDFKKNPTLWMTSLNKQTEITELGGVSAATVHNEARELAFGSQKVITPHQLPNYSVDSGGDFIFIDGRIGSAFSGNTKKGKPKGTLKLMEAGHNQDAQIKPAFTTFYEQVSDIYKYGQSSHIIVGCEIRPSTRQGGDPFITAKFQIPVVVVPGQPPNQPGLPAAYTPPTK